MTHKVINIAAMLAFLLSASSLALAQPAHAPAHGVNSQQGHERQAGSSQRALPSSAQRGIDLPRINERELRRLLGEHSRSGEAIPPGIGRRIERGKPLPPGIAKRLEPPLAARLPHYNGYEWEQVGRDVVLIEAATRIVVDVLEDALQ